MHVCVFMYDTCIQSRFVLRYTEYTHPLSDHFITCNRPNFVRNFLHGCFRLASNAGHVLSFLLRRHDLPFTRHCLALALRSSDSTCHAFFVSSISRVSQCRHLQEKPNPLVLARLAKADRELVALATTSSTVAGAGAGDANDDADSGDGRRRDFLCLLSQPRELRALDLRECRLTDREVRVLLHVLSEESVRDRPTAAGAAAAAGDATPGRGAGTAESEWFNALLLGGNPGIGAGALETLWGGGRGGGGGGSTPLCALLVRLDLSRCGLAAADLVGFSSASGGGDDDGDGDGGVVSASDRASAAAVCCLRELVLRDNPLTRVKKGRGVGAGAQQWIEPARKGVAALRDLIARAPALEVLDMSGEGGILHFSVNLCRVQTPCVIYIRRR